MSHELRTPLNSIIGFSDVLRGRSTRSTTSRSATSQNIQKSGQVLLDMINDILDLAKIESGQDGSAADGVPHRPGRRRPVRRAAVAERGKEHRPARRHRARPAAGLSRSDESAADLDEPAVERDQVHAGRRAHHRARAARRTGPAGNDRGRYGRRHCAGRSRGDFREIPPRFERPSAAICSPVRTRARAWGCRSCASWRFCSAAK